MLHCTQSRSFGNNALHRRVSCASHLARRGLSNGRRTRALRHRCSFRAPAANPGPTVHVESYFPFAEPMGIWRGHAEDRLQPMRLHPSGLQGSAEPFQGEPMASSLMRSSLFPPKTGGRGERITTWEVAGAVVPSRKAKRRIIKK